MFGLHYLKDVVTLELNPELCNGCRMCIVVCPHAVFEMNGKRVRIVNRDACMECGACMMNCEESAIFVESGVGCAEAIMKGAVTGTEPACGCSEDGGSC
jgi:NAD-dependent dihydropyrimidine dehydrogenase PreA subunit